MAPKTNAQRQADWRERKKAADPNFTQKESQKRQVRRLKNQLVKKSPPGKLPVHEAILEHQSRESEAILKRSSKESKRLIKSGDTTRKLVAQLLLGDGVDDHSKPSARDQRDARESEPSPRDHRDAPDSEPSPRDQELSGHEALEDTTIELPLTLDKRSYEFNFDEDIVLSTWATKLLQYLFENFVPGVKPADGLGKVLRQIERGLPHYVVQDLRYLLHGCTRVQHKKWEFELTDPHQYERVMVRVFTDLCPNWTLVHCNPATDRLKDENKELKRRLDSYDGRKDSGRKRGRCE